MSDDAKRGEDLSEEIKALFCATALPKDALAEIGRVVAQFAILEHQLKRLIQGLLGGQETEKGERIVRVITSEMSFRALVDLSAALIRELRGDELADEYKIVTKVVSTAEDERNIVSHSFWGIGMPLSGSEEVFVRTKYTARRKKGLNFRRDELDINDLKRNADKIGIAIYELRLFASGKLSVSIDY